MKRLLSTTILGLVTLLLLTGCQSAPYQLMSVAPHRIEVTKALDARPDAKAAAFIAPFHVGVDSLRMPYLGESEQYMASHRPESLLSNWVADAFVAAAQRMGYEPDFGLCNIGGLRAALPKGRVCRGDIMAIAPFENHFTVIKLKGSDVMELMQNIATVLGEGVSSAVRLVITMDKQLQSATIGGQPIDPERIYTIATLDYVADGNDKLVAMKKAVERFDTEELVRETLMKQIKQLDQQGEKIQAEIEGRVTISDLDEGQQQVQQEEPKSLTAALPIRSSANGKKRELLIVHTNDTHSCVEPLNPNLADTTQANKGGYLRRVALLNELRARDPKLLLVDAGDFSQGSAYYNLYHGDVEVGLMNIMGYDAATIGNHEFDFGVENMARLFRMAKFPIVCCNYDFTGTACEGLVKPYVIIKRNGLKIGIFGVSPKLEGLVSAHTCQGVRFSDPVTAAQPIADYLKNEAKCDLVVCLSHLGWNVAGVSDEEFIPSTRNIDVVIGGHSHTYFVNPELLTNLNGVVVPNNQMGKNARYVGTLRLTLSK